MPKEATKIRVVVRERAYEEGGSPMVTEIFERDILPDPKKDRREFMKLIGRVFDSRCPITHDIEDIIVEFVA